MGRRFPISLVCGLLAGATAGLVQEALDDDGDPYRERIVAELLATEQRRAEVPHGGHQRFEDLLPIVEGRGFPLVVVGRVRSARAAYGYGEVAEPCDLPQGSGASCAGPTSWQTIPIDDGRAAEVVILATVEIDEVLDNETSSEDPAFVRVEWIVSGPFTPSPVDPDEVADALVALGPAVWVLTEPGVVGGYATNEIDPHLAGIAWRPFGIARIVDGGRLAPLAGRIPDELDTLTELRRALAS